MRSMRNPLLLILLNYVVGALVAKGIIQPNDHGFVVEQLADIVGLGIILATTIVSLFKVIKHNHADDMETKTVPALTDEQHMSIKDLVTKLITVDPTALIHNNQPLPPPTDVPSDMHDSGTPAQVVKSGQPIDPK